jgi:hypothetical protein
MPLQTRLIPGDRRLLADFEFLRAIGRFLGDLLRDVFLLGHNCAERVQPTRRRGHRQPAPSSCGRRAPTEFH